MRVVTVPVLEDNYAYLLIDEASATAMAVDPVEPAKLLEAAEAEKVTIQGILTTHAHWDHDGGNNAFVKARPGTTVYGGKHDAAEAVTMPLEHGQEVVFGGIVIRALHTPFHTPGHICYYCTTTGAGAAAGEAADSAASASSGASDAPGVVFTGDSLFVAGCGRINGSGTAEQMKASLVDVLATLPGDTLAYVGHEYTRANIAFALVVEPDNDALLELKRRTDATLESKGITVPTTIQSELATNPFLRPESAQVRAYVQAHGGVASGASATTVLGALRTLKNRFGLGASAGST